MSESILEIFERTGALLTGHFVLSSGLHSRKFFQCALVLQDATLAAQICQELASKLADVECESIIYLALDGIILGQDVARGLGRLHLFSV